MTKVKLFLGAMLLSLVGFTAFEVQASADLTATSAKGERSDADGTCYGCRNGLCKPCRVVGQSGAGSTACIDGAPFLCSFVGEDCVPPPC